MPAHPDPASLYLPALSPEPPADDTVALLYRAALGPVSADVYLQQFERFDATGRTTTSWNWAACVCTLNWMVFRQLWSAALVYVAAAQGLALLVFGLGRQWLQWPQGVEWGVVGAFGMLAFAIPGLYGNALLHADIRKRVAHALSASHTVAQACTMLDHQASSRRRLQVVVLANLVIAAAAALAYLLIPGTASRATTTPDITVAQASSAARPMGDLPQATATAPNANANANADAKADATATTATAPEIRLAGSAPTLPVTPIAAPTSTPVLAQLPAQAATTATTATASTPPRSANANANASANSTANSSAKTNAQKGGNGAETPVAAVAPGVPASAAAPRPFTAAAPATAPVASRALTPASPPASAPITARLAVSSPAAKDKSADDQRAASPSAAPTPVGSQDLGASARAPSKRKVASQPSNATAAPTAAASQSRGTAASNSVGLRKALPAPVTVGTASGYYINVGLFAEEANARRAQAKLLNEGLPAFRQTLGRGDTQRIRVRVGPYARKAQAQAAAQSIRALSLDAVVFKQ